MIACILERFGFLSVLFIAVTFNVNCGQQSNSQKVSMSDTLKLTRCRKK